MEFDELEKEAKLKKKLFRVGRNAARSIGGGLGLMAIPSLFSAVSSSEHASILCHGIGLTLAAYGLIVLLALIFWRKRVFLVKHMMLFFIVPAVITKIVVSLH